MRPREGGQKKREGRQKKKDWTEIKEKVDRKREKGDRNRKKGREGNRYRKREGERLRENETKKRRSEIDAEGLDGHTPTTERESLKVTEISRMKISALLQRCVIKRSLSPLYFLAY